MSQHYYHLCCRYKGKVVRITDKAGRVHVGRICRVTPHKVYIEPMIRRGGYGFGFGGWGWGFGAPFGIAFGFIAGFALGSLFFW